MLLKVKLMFFYWLPTECPIINLLKSFPTITANLIMKKFNKVSYVYWNAHVLNLW